MSYCTELSNRLGTPPKISALYVSMFTLDVLIIELSLAATSTLLFESYTLNVQKAKTP